MMTFFQFFSQSRQSLTANRKAHYWRVYFCSMRMKSKPNVLRSEESKSGSARCDSRRQTSAHSQRPSSPTDERFPTSRNCTKRSSKRSRLARPSTVQLLPGFCINQYSARLDIERKIEASLSTCGDMRDHVEWRSRGFKLARVQFMYCTGYYRVSNQM